MYRLAWNPNPSSTTTLFTPQPNRFDHVSNRLKRSTYTGIHRDRQIPSTRSIITSTTTAAAIYLHLRLSQISLPFSNCDGITNTSTSTDSTAITLPISCAGLLCNCPPCTGSVFRPGTCRLKVPSHAILVQRGLILTHGVRVSREGHVSLPFTGKQAHHRCGFPTRSSCPGGPTTF